MIPAGYMYKKVSVAAGQVKAANVVDFFSVGICGADISPYFTEYIPHWQHNGYWFFNTSQIMQTIASEADIDLCDMTLFYYELYEFELERANDGQAMTWMSFEPNPSFFTAVTAPQEKKLAGYDVVEYVLRDSPGCSLLSCCDLACEFAVNSHCLFDTFEEAKAAAESGKFHDCEPGPYRIIAVYHNLVD